MFNIFKNNKSKPQVRLNGMFNYFVCWMVFCIVMAVVGLGTLGWVAYHFISKVW